MKNIRIKFTNERIIHASGLDVVGAILAKSDFVKHCNRMTSQKTDPNTILKMGTSFLPICCAWESLHTRLSTRWMMTRYFMLRANGIVPSKLPNGYVPVDINVTPFDNSKQRRKAFPIPLKDAMAIPEDISSIRNCVRASSTTSTTRLHS